MINLKQGTRFTFYTSVYHLDIVSLPPSCMIYCMHGPLELSWTDHISWHSSALANSSSILSTISMTVSAIFAFFEGLVGKTACPVRDEIHHTNCFLTDISCVTFCYRQGDLSIKMWPSEFGKVSLSFCNFNHF